MFDISKAQTSDMELLTKHPEITQQDSIDDLRFMSYQVPHEDVAEILGVLAMGVKEL